MMEKPSRRTFRKRLDEMVTELRDQIITGKLGAGSFLPSESRLVEEYQLSNKSVRKGLDVLASEGLIEKLPRVGTVVASRKITITLGCRSTIYKDSELGQIIANFHKEHPHIQVQILTLSFDRYFGTIQEYMENGMLDLVMLNHANFEDFIENDSLDMLEPLEKKRDIYPFLTKAFTSEDQLYAQPFIFSPVVLCYNKKHFAEQGLLEPDSSWSWEDLLETGANLTKENERYGFYFHLLSDNRWPVFMLQNNVFFENDPIMRKRMYETRLKESIEFCRHFHKTFPGLLSEGDSDIEQLFLQEKVSIILTTYMSLNKLKHSSISYDVAPLPYLKQAKTLLLMIGLALNKNAKEKQAAQTFLDYLVSQQAQKVIRRQTLCIPSVKAAAEFEEESELNRPSRFAMYREIVPTFGLYEDMNLSVKEVRLIREQLKIYFSGIHDEEAMFRELEQRLFKTEEQPV